MHGVTHTIEQIRERGVPGFEVEVIGTDAGVDRRLPAAAELRDALLRGDDARRARPAGPGRDPGRGPLRPRPRHRARARRGSPRPCSAAITGVPLLGQLPHRAGRLRRHAQRRRRHRGDRPRRPSAPSTAPPGSSSRRARRPIARWSTSASTRPRIGRWERGVDIDRFDPAKADRDAYPGEIKVLYAGRLTREKGVDLLAESFLRARALRPAPAPAARRRRPRGGGAARAARRARDLPRLARRRGAGPRLRQRRRLPLRQQHRHLRPGDPRGRRQRPAGGRGRRGRPGGAGREPPHRPALPARPRPPGGRAAPARLLAAAAPPPRRRRAPRPPAPAPGSARWSSSPPATGGPWTPRAAAPRRPFAQAA